MKRKKNVVLFICLMIVLIPLICFFSQKKLADKEKIEAKPNETTTIDIGSVYQQLIPADAPNLIEPELISKGTFHNYVQDATKVKSFRKNRIFAESSMVNDNISSAVRTSDGGVISLRIYNGYNQNKLNKLDMRTAALIKTDAQGNEITRVWLNTTEPPYIYGAPLNPSVTFQAAAPSLIFKTNSVHGDYVVYWMQGRKRFQTIFKENLALYTAEMNNNNYTFYGTYNRSAYDPIRGTKYIMPYVTDAVADTQPGDDRLNYLKYYRINEEGQFIGEIKAQTIENYLWIHHNTNYQGLLGGNRPGRNYVYNGIAGNSVATDYRERTIMIQEMGDINASENRFQGLVVYNKNNEGIEYMYLPVENQTQMELTYQPDISTDKKYYFTRKKVIDGSFDLMVYDSVEGRVQETPVLSFPKGSNVKFSKAPEGGNTFYGRVPAFTGSLSGLGPEQTEAGGYLVLGNTDTNFSKIASANHFNVDVKNLNIEGLIYLNDAQKEDYFIYGRFTGVGNAGLPDHFVDKIVAVTVDQYTDKTGLDNPDAGTNAFYGSLKLKDDFAPVIKAPSMTLDREFFSKEKDGRWNDPAYGYNQIDGYNYLDRYLITGNPHLVNNPALNLPNRIEVYDNHDFNYSLNPGLNNQDWLNKRINRNPKVNLTNMNSHPIDWNALGFQQNKIGPQRVTYFVSDSQKQITATSRIVNTKARQTTEAGNYFIDANNFHIPLNGIANAIPDANTFKRLAKTLVWNGTDGKIYENSEINIQSEYVVVNNTQLQALRNAANTKENAKPFPVDITFQYELGKYLTNRVWVFTTTKNTVPNNEPGYTAVTPEETNGYVYYADDYSLPLVSAKYHTGQDILNNANVRVYDYYSIEENSPELPTIIDKANNQSLLNLLNLPNIQGAVETGVVKPDFEFVYGGETTRYHTQNRKTKGTLDITLTGEIKLNIRQVVLDSQKDLVVPKEGYVKLLNMNPDTSKSQRALFNAVTNSGKYTGVFSSEPLFKTYKLVLDTANNKKVVIKPIIPEFYEYAGYISTQAYYQHERKNIANHEYTYDLLGQAERYEMWVTLYIKPIVTDENLPSPYSWDYKLNDFGTIKIE
ncbi:hypothetical protein [Candidatus Enterococcus ferrettii]|uniref:DUF5704 domain-containing protein n=1 Tax=Candidatus Enterococcus ferrettii TaxID=2815324 RepID=A0ABV0EVM0_9ENTE|nr:hypothetical protein [Enterococcus sp. 665A]MBO1342884.1 hypothetical protein [Enterococcus sp. 665A]